MKSILVLFSILFCMSTWAQTFVEEQATITEIIDHTHFAAVTSSELFDVGDRLPIYKQKSNTEALGFAEVVQIELTRPRKLVCKIVRQNRTSFIRPGDYLLRIDLRSDNPRYLGNVELLIPNSRQVSSKYKPLVYRGSTNGQTATTFSEGEYFVNFLGNVGYGVTPNVTVYSFLTTSFFGVYNLGLKYKFFENAYETISFSPEIVYIDRESETVNKQTLGIFKFYWDSTAGGNVISHTVLTLTTQTSAEGDGKIIFASTSLSSGYQVILKNWDRVLFGPNYNFDLKTVGGYLGYISVWDTFHLETTLATTNISSGRLDASNGYYLSADMFWRY